MKKISKKLRNILAVKVKDTEVKEFEEALRKDKA